MEIDERILRVLSENGVDVSLNDWEEELDLDSIQFVSIIVELETEFLIEIPDKYLAVSELPTVSHFKKLIEKLISTV